MERRTPSTSVGEYVCVCVCEYVCVHVFVYACSNSLVSVLEHPIQYHCQFTHPGNGSYLSPSGRSTVGSSATSLLFCWSSNPSYAAGLSNV